VVVASTLTVAACGGGNAQQVVAQPAAPVNDAPAAAPAAAAPAAAAPVAAAPAAPAPAAAAPATAAQVAEPTTTKTTKAVKAAPAPKAAPAAKAADAPAAAVGTARSGESAAEQAANLKIYSAAKGATDRGITRDEIHLGSINMWGGALSNLAVAPMVRGNQATAAAINDRGGVLGRRIVITDCDDGVGDASRAKSCVKKLVSQDRIFALITAWDWGTASMHDDLAANHLPYVGSWAYSQTEWQDPWMFPTHMSMIHEALAGGNWVKNVIHPKTYGLLCLTSPEMQLACNNVQKVLEPTGAKMVKRVDAAVSESTMSPYVLAMRAANPDHIVHYVINPTTEVKFVVEAAQQGYWPPKGVSGNHLAAEVLGVLFGKWPAGRYWTNTTYKMWGAGFMATMLKYAPGNRGLNFHIVQAGYVGLNMFAEATKAIGPNLTHDRLRAALGNRVWNADADMGQKFTYTRAERGDSWRDDTGMGHEYMYKYTSANTISNPDGSPNGFELDPTQGDIYTRK
jgi:hypothetical protein